MSCSTVVRRNTSGSGGAVDSVFGRTGAVVAASGDYSASEVTNDSGVTGATVKAALDNLNTTPTLSQVLASGADMDASVSQTAGQLLMKVQADAAGKAAPALSAVGDTNTGIYFLGGGQFRFTASGGRIASWLTSFIQFDKDLYIPNLFMSGGTFQYGTHTAIGAETVTGYITMKDGGGTTRKMAIVS